MQHSLEIKAFFFNAKTDYTPYYKLFTININENSTLLDLLAEIKQRNENFTYPLLNTLAKINGLVTEGQEKISSIVEKLGTSLEINPANSYRSTNGLVMNDSDFIEKFNILKSYTSDEDKEYYKTLYALHYASESERFDHDYIGDAVLVLAHKMIIEGSEHKDEILKAIAHANSGLFDCEYENNLFNEEDHTSSINELKKMITNPNKTGHITSLFSKLYNKKSKPPEAKRENINKVSYYLGASKANTQNMYKSIEEAGLSIVSFSRQKKLAGTSLLKDSKELAYKKAGTTLLDAMDSGAELLLVEDQDDFNMFNEHHANIARVMGRDIELSILLASEFDRFLEEKITEDSPEEIV